jgi:hypothetical protein
MAAHVAVLGYISPENPKNELPTLQILIYVDKNSKKAKTHAAPYWN